MGSNRKREVEPASDIERAVQETTILVAESERLVAQLEGLLKRARQLAGEQRAYVDSLKKPK